MTSMAAFQLEKRCVLDFFFPLFVISISNLSLNTPFFMSKMQLNFNLSFNFCFQFQQANVYHATKSDGQELAIKVYKTSVLVFKYV